MRQTSARRRSKPDLRAQKYRGDPGQPVAPKDRLPFVAEDGAECPDCHARVKINPVSDTLKRHSSGGGPVSIIKGWPACPSSGSMASYSIENRPDDWRISERGCRRTVNLATGRNHSTQQSWTVDKLHHEFRDGVWHDFITDDTAVELTIIEATVPWMVTSAHCRVCCPDCRGWGRYSCYRRDVDCEHVRAVVDLLITEEAP